MSSSTIFPSAEVAAALDAAVQRHPAGGRHRAADPHHLVPRAGGGWSDTGPIPVTIPAVVAEVAVEVAEAATSWVRHYAPYLLAAVLYVAMLAAMVVAR